MLQRFPFFQALPVLTAIILLASCASLPTPQPSLNFNASSDATGFARAIEPREFRFPEDHGAHFDFQTEWWYYTGNLKTDRGESVGYQLTFFRRGLTSGTPTRGSAFGANQVYFAHFAITDVKGDTHSFAERFSRGAAGLAGATGSPYSVWLEDWRAESLNADGSNVRLKAKNGDMEIDLTLKSAKPIVAHGDRGLSPKSEERGNASFYLSYTRMNTDGTVSLRGQTVKVSGESWFDHEWSTSALGKDGIGWDWFSLQLSDGRELMLFQIRTKDGGIETVSGGTLVEKDGNVKRLAASDVKIEVLEKWTSPQTKGKYPSKWRVTIPQLLITLDIVPYLKSQEIRVSFVYWEGAVKMSGTSNGVNVTGDGYIEMTGYAGSMQGVF
jgi:predicted secreted hydrolase